MQLFVKRNSMACKKQATYLLLYTTKQNTGGERNKL